MSEYIHTSILDPRTKLMIIIALVICVMYTSDLYALLGFLSFSLIFLLFIKLKTKYLIVSLISLTIFSVIATLFARYLNSNDDFLRIFLLIEIRFIVALFSMLWFFSTVKPYELAVALEKMHIPPKFIWFLTAIYQIIPTVSQEARNINEIRKLKGLSAKKYNVKGQYQVIKYTLKPMISSSINRGVDLAEAMILKGYKGEKRKIFALNLKLKKIDYISMICSLIFIVITILFLGF